MISSYCFINVFEILIFCQYDEDEEEGDHGSSPAGNPFKGTVTAPPIPKARPHREEETKRKPNVFNKFLRTVQHLQKIEYKRDQSKGFETFTFEFDSFNLPMNFVVGVCLGVLLTMTKYF